MARPFKDDKQIPVGIKLYPWMDEWLRVQPISKGKMIEKAIRGHYNITDEMVEIYKAKAEQERIKKLDTRGKE